MTPHPKNTCATDLERAIMWREHVYRRLHTVLHDLSDPAQNPLYAWWCLKVLACQKLKS